MSDQRRNNAIARLYEQLSSHIDFDPIQLTGILSRVFYRAARNQFICVTVNHELITVTERSFLTILRYSIFKSDFIRSVNDQDDKKEKAKHLKVVEKLLMSFVDTENQIIGIVEKTEFFKKSTEIVQVDGVITITYPLRLTKMKIGLHKYKEDQNSDYVKLYLEHFKELHEILDLLIAGRFSPDRKKAYLWLKTSSDWGKTFLINLLDELGLVMHLSVTECKAAFEGKALGRHPVEFIRCVAIVFEEFAIMKDELKQLETTLPVTPKFGFTQRVDIYTKLFFSADSVENLVTEHGIEDQYANRMNIIFGDKKLPVTSETKNPMFRACVYYVAKTLTEIIKSYEPLTANERQDKAVKIIDEFYQDHQIGNSYQRLSENLDQIGIEFINYITSKQNGYSIGNAPDSGEPVFVVNDISYLQCAPSAFTQFLKETKTKEEAEILKKKQQQIFASVQAEQQREKAYGRTTTERINQFGTIRVLVLRRKFNAISLVPLQQSNE